MFRRLIFTFGILLAALLLLLGLVLSRIAVQHRADLLEHSLRQRLALVEHTLRSSPESLQDAMRSFPETPRISVLDAQSEILADSRPLEGERVNSASLPEVARASQGDYRAEVREGPDGEEWLFVVLRCEEPIKGASWIRAASPLSSIPALGTEIRTTLTLFGIAGLIIILFLAGALTRRFERPLTDLIVAANQITENIKPEKVYPSGRSTLGRLVHAFNRMVRHITRRTTELEEEQQRLRTILSGMIEGVIALDAEQHVLFVNDRARRLLNLSDNVPVGRKLWDVVRQRALIDVCTRALSKGEPQQEELNWYGPANRNLTVYAAPLPGSPPVGAVIVIDDTTELRRLERLRQEFVANVSHELKTPLAVIRPCVETLLNGAMEDPVHGRRFLEQIIVQSERLHRLILDLLSLARIESGAELFSFERLDVEEVVTDALERQGPRSEEKQQAMNLEVINGPMSIHADEEAICEILDNLIDNAVKYTPQGGSIRIHCHAEKNEVVLIVQDSGIGIPKEDIPRIFERFYRVDKARSREMGGTGLGLSIVKHLVNAMRGTISVESDEGTGTTFTVRFPHCPEDVS